MKGLGIGQERARHKVEEGVGQNNSLIEREGMGCPGSSVGWSIIPGAKRLWVRSLVRVWKGGNRLMFLILSLLLSLSQ